MSIVFIISAPSGSGKSTLVQLLMAADSKLAFSISYTTRRRRELERDGEDYHFISRPEFETRIEKGEFIEYAEVFGNYYGTHQSALEDARARGVDLLLDIDVQGARQLKDRLPEAVTIFVLPPSREVLERRLRARSSESDAVVERRLRGAAEEVRNYRQYDYALINDDLHDSVAGLRAIVGAERIRRVRMEERIRPILRSFEAVISTTEV